MGKRKLKGYYITSTLLTFAFVMLYFGIIKVGGTADHLLTLGSVYIASEGGVTGAFFGFNFGEHWANNKK